MEKKTFLKLFLIVNIFLISFNLFAEKFVLAVIPDSQSYVAWKYQHKYNRKYPYSHYPIYERQIDYIVENSISNGGNIAFAFHLGDLVDTKPTPLSEWKMAEKATAKLNGVVPYATTPGNHDFDYWIRKNKTDHSVYALNTYKYRFGEETKHFAVKKNCESYRGGSSSFETFVADGIEFGVLALEFQCDQKCLNWAQSVLDKYKNTPVIVFSHEYITQKYSTGDKSLADYAVSNTYRKNGVTPEELSKKLILKNPQIFMVLCGHIFNSKGYGESVRFEKNDYGRTVYAMLSNYQNIPYEDEGGKPCGNGWLRLLEFDLDNMKIHVQTFSTEKNEFETDWNSDFIIDLDEDWKDFFNKN